MLIDTTAALMRTLMTNSKGVFKLKPRVLFNLIENNFEHPVDMQCQIPSSGIGSITLLEGAALITALQLTRPQQVFEFGTFLGYSTALLLRNTGESCHITSIDLGDNSDQYSDAARYSDAELRIDDKKNDDYLRFTQSIQGPRYLISITPQQQGRLTLLRGDSTHLNVAAAGLSDVVDFVFVDGGHDSSTIASDTRKALEMIGANGVVAWHDYDSKIHSDVTDFIGAFSQDHLIFHVENTMLAFLFKGKCVEHLTSKA